MEVGQRVKSLDRERDYDFENERITNRARMASKQSSEKQLRRVSIVQPNKKHIQSGTRLPELKFKR